MKNFLFTVLIWMVGLTVFTFLLAAYFFDGQHIYRAMVLAALVFAVITHNFEQQSERIKTLEKRVEALEKEHASDKDVESK